MKKRVNHCLVQHGIYLSSLVSFPAPSFLPSPLLIFLQTKHAIRFFQSKQVDGFINKSQANQKTKKKGFQMLTNPGSSGLEMVQERKTLP